MRTNGMDSEEMRLREAIIAKCRWMNASGLTEGTSGNISARHEGRMLITPSATPYDALKPEMIASMPITGEYGTWDGPLKPSTEWRFHLDIMIARPEVGAIVHAHSSFATVLAILRREIPACHYMIAAFGGDTVRCARYATFGTKALSRNALAALEGRNSCLLANHGMIATGPSLEKAMWTAVELETLARQYYYALALGKPAILTAAQMEDARKGFATYGLQDTSAPAPVPPRRLSPASARRVAAAAPRRQPRPTRP
jgi:L-fuculose-phosphate aldolase